MVINDQVEEGHDLALKGKKPSVENIYRRRRDLPVSKSRVMCQSSSCTGNTSQIFVLPKMKWFEDIQSKFLTVSTESKTI
jgi:hypothetical protein